MLTDVEIQTSLIPYAYKNVKNEYHLLLASIPINPTSSSCPQRSL